MCVSLCVCTGSSGDLVGCTRHGQLKCAIRRTTRAGCAVDAAGGAMVAAATAATSTMADDVPCAAASCASGARTARGAAVLCGAVLTSCARLGCVSASHLHRCTTCCDAARTHWLATRPGMAARLRPSCPPRFVAASCHASADIACCGGGASRTRGARRGDVRVRFLPFTVTWPRVAFSSIRMSRNSVLLPAPEWPVINTISPACN